MNHGKNKMYGGKKMTAGGKKKAQAGMGAMAKNIAKLKKLAEEATTKAKRAYYERQIVKKMKEDPNYGEHEASADLAEKLKRAGGKKKMGMGGDYMEPSKELKFGGPSKKKAQFGVPAGAKKATKATDGRSATSKLLDKLDKSSAKRTGDDRSFSQAFTDARKANKTTFMWRGKKYSSKKKGEAEAAPKKLESKKATTVDSGVKKPGLQTSKTTIAPKSKKEQRADKREGNKEARGQRRAGRKETTRLDRKAGRLMDRADKARGKAKAKDKKMSDRRAKKAKVKEAKAALKSARKMTAGGLKDVPEGSKGKGLSKLPTNVRNKMGFKKYGGKKMMGMGGKKKAQFGMIGKIKGAIDGAKGAEGGFGKKLMGAAKGALGGGMLGRGIGAVKGAMGGGGLQGAMQGFKQGAFGSAEGGAQQAPAAEGQDMTQQQQARYGVMDRRKMGKGGTKKKKMTAGGMRRSNRLSAKARSAQIKAKKMASNSFALERSGVGGKEDVALEKQRAKANKARARANKAKRGIV
tara:strand:+ start:2155 stop:3717 length:1563 start_codon:yes stop_codon:yes gene_type:complete